MLRLALALFLVFFPMIAKPPTRAGIGTGEHTGSCAVLRALRVEHAYNWASKPAWVWQDCPEIEFVPMAWDSYGTGWEARAIERDWLATHPTSSVYILNEPNDPYQANLTCEEAGQSVEQYALDIWADYPGARLIIGGILTRDYDGRSPARGILYAECMVANMQSDIYARVLGWAFHFYPMYSGEPDVAKAAIAQLAAWAHAQDKAFWLSEVGLIGWAAAWPDSIKAAWMTEMVRWLDGEAPMERWSWFIGKCDPVWPCPATLELWDADGELTQWGRIYQGRDDEQGISG